MARVCVICAVGLTPELAVSAPRVVAVGKPKPLRGVFPAVTATAQATLLSGTLPSQHGIVANGWLYRDTREVRFWQQSNALIDVVPRIYDGVRTAKMFWWFNQGANVEWYATPKPHYGSDGSKVFDIIDRTGVALEASIGKFPFPSFWGPQAGLPSSRWIAAASARVLRENQPDLSLVYLPHLDYDHQRNGPGNPACLAGLDECIGTVVDAANDIDARTLIVSEYGIVPVSRPVPINRILREAGWLEVRKGPFGEMLDTFESKAFAVSDHQIAHLYLRGVSAGDVRSELEALPGIDAIVPPGDVGLAHARSGELVAIAEADSWFTYDYWLDPDAAPDFANTVDIHRKPGFDPCELLMGSKPRAAFRLLQKTLGFRYRMDVVRLAPEDIRGSHGLRPPPAQGPVIVGDGAPDDMVDVFGHVRSMLG
jgi:predicted AlkP superfamily pyrophosphatase or phosphodiesterase